MSWKMAAKRCLPAQKGDENDFLWMGSGEKDKRGKGREGEHVGFGGHRKDTGETISSVQPARFRKGFHRTPFESR